MIKRLFRNLLMSNKRREIEQREELRKKQQEEQIRMLNERQDRDIDLDGEV